METESEQSTSVEPVKPFYSQEGVDLSEIPVGGGVPLGTQRIYNPELGIGGAYGTWGDCYDNQELVEWINRYLDVPLASGEIMDLSSLGFLYRHHISELPPDEDEETEIKVGGIILAEAAHACGWDPGEIEAVFIGTSCPVTENFTEKIAEEAGIPTDALKVSVHKACDGSVGGLHLALNPQLTINGRAWREYLPDLSGKKILVGGIEGLSRVIRGSMDKNALQLFGNGAGVIGLVPGFNMNFLTGKSYEVYDEQGVLAVQMKYPHSKRKESDESNLELSQPGQHHIRIAGLMNEPTDGRPIAMAGPMGMVKLFVRSGVQVVREVYQSYLELLNNLQLPNKKLAIAIVHHANLKINRLKEKHLNDLGIVVNMPWLVSEFGNVSAASNMIAFMRRLKTMLPGDHVLFDGFGAGTYYDTLVVELGAGNT